MIVPYRAMLCKTCTLSSMLQKTLLSMCLLLPALALHGQQTRSDFQWDGRTFFELQKLLAPEPTRLSPGIYLGKKSFLDRKARLFEQDAAELPPTYLHPSRLPWKVECLPFFCRIEHNMGKKMRIPFKFRLGSVQYVDWLEGKTGFPTFAP